MSRTKKDVTSLLLKLIPEVREILEKLSPEELADLRYSSNSGGLLEQISDLMFGHRTKIAAGYEAVVRRQLDLDMLLSATLNFVLSEISPSNLGIFLRDGRDVVLGGYVNYTGGEKPELLLDLMAEILGKQSKKTTELHIRSQGGLFAFLGNDWLCGSEFYSIKCETQGENLAMICAWRQADDPFKEEEIEVLRTVASILAHQLAKVVSVHWRAKVFS